MNRKLIIGASLVISAGLLLTGCTGGGNGNGNNPNPANTNANGNPDAFNISLMDTPKGDDVTFSLTEVPKGFTVEQDVPQKDSTDTPKDSTKDFKNLYMNSDDGSCVVTVVVNYLPQTDAGKGDLYITKNFLYQMALRSTPENERSVAVNTADNGTVEFRSINYSDPNFVYDANPDVAPKEDGVRNYILAARGVDRSVATGFPAPEPVDPTYDPNGLATYSISYGCVNKVPDPAVFDDFLSKLVINGVSKP